MIELGLGSVAEIYDFIKQFHFKSGYGVDLYNDMTFSDTSKIRVSPAEGHVVLKRDSITQFYPTEDDIWARTWVTNPLSARKLKMIQLLPNIEVADTERKVRLYDGTNDLYWDGVTWSIAGAGNWNTEAEINANIETFPLLPDREFAVTINLKTTDREVTPEVTEVRVLMEIHIDYIEDIVLRSLLPAFEDAIDPVANMAHIPEFTTDVSTIDLSEYRRNIPFNISDVAGVYDLTDDPERLYNQLDNYNPATSVITLSTPLPAGHRPIVLIRYKPEIVFIQHQDWYEVDKVPCLLIQSLEVPFTSAYNQSAREGIVDKGTGNAVVLKEPWRATFEFRIHGLTGGLVDEFRLQSRVIEFFEKNPMLRSTGLDELYRMRIEREFRDLSSPSRSDQRAFWTRFTVNDVRMPFVSESAHAVQRVSLTFKGPKSPTVLHEDPVKGGSRIVATTHTEDGPVEFTETVEIT